MKLNPAGIYKIINNRIENVKFIQSPNIGKGTIIPELLLLHYTAGTSMKGAVNTFSNPNSKVSAHIVIERDGTLTQMSSFTSRCFHAGESTWKGRDAVNGFSIGIELVNLGKLIQKQNGLCYGWQGSLVASEDTYKAVDGSVWQMYPKKQLETLWDLTRALVDNYKTIKEVVAHSDVSPGRKLDVGPSFPMKEMRMHLFGREYII